MIPLAVIAGVGVFLFVQALGPRRVRVRLTEADQRPYVERLIESVFLPVSVRLASLGGRVDVDEQRRTLETKLAQAGYPPPFTTPEAVLGFRLFTAVLFALFGAIWLLFADCRAMAPVSMVVLALIGWALPDRIIADAIRQRREQLTLDAASTLDRLAIFVAAGNALPSAVRSLAERRGGLWVALFRRVAGYYATDGDFAGALERVARETGNLPEVSRVCERLRAAYEMGGGGVADALRRMAGDARTNVRLVLTERGYRNAVLMVVPAFFAIVATIIILIAPGALRLVTML